MHSFEVHSNESACRKKVRLWLEQVYTLLVLNFSLQSNFLIILWFLLHSTIIDLILLPPSDIIATIFWICPSPLRSSQYTLSWIVFFTYLQYTKLCPFMITPLISSWSAIFLIHICFSKLWLIWYSLYQTNLFDTLSPL